MKKLQGKIAGAFIALALAAGITVSAQPPTFTVLHSFAGPTGDGANPAGALIMDAAGNFYGTTAFGGITNCGVNGLVGCGTVFKIDAAGNETVLYRFSGPDGAIPAAGLVMDAAGNLYGTTVNGGGAGPCRIGCGTVFKLDPSGNETVVHAFTGGPDGGNPTAPLIMDSSGALYGTTGFGGIVPCGVIQAGCGTVFKLDPATGQEMVLHSFTRAEGGEPSAALIMDTAGNFYSTTFRAGPFGVGTVFKLDPLGNLTVLHGFTDGIDGGNSAASLIMDTAGNLYGTTETGGAFLFGTVFELSPSGTLTPIHAFTGGSDGGSLALEGVPSAGLIMDPAQNLYGAVSSGGDGGFGTVFKIDTANTFTVLHSFTGGSDGGNPIANLIMDAGGNFLSTASAIEDSSSLGTVFKLGVQTPQQATEGIIDSVNALFAQGVLNGGQHNSLVTQLQHALDLMNAGKNNGAIGNLNSFISEVNDLLNSGILTSSQATSLISAAQSVIARLQ